MGHTKAVTAHGRKTLPEAFVNGGTMRNSHVSTEPDPEESWFEPDPDDAEADRTDDGPIPLDKLPW